MPDNGGVIPFLADIVASQRYLNGDWFVIPEEGVIFNRYRQPVKGTKNGKYSVIGTEWFGYKVNIMYHRAVWICSHGGIIPSPDMQIDHINGNPEDNRVSNLRCVTCIENVNNPNTRKGFKLTERQSVELAKTYHTRSLTDNPITMRELADFYKVSVKQAALAIHHHPISEFNIEPKETTA